MKQHKNKIIAAVVIVAVLAVAFFWGGNFNKNASSSTLEETAKGAGVVFSQIAGQTGPDDTQTLSEEEIEKQKDEAGETAEETKEEEQKEAEKKEEDSAKKTDKKEEKKQEINPKTGKDKYKTTPVPEGKPVPVEPQEQDVTGTKLTCTLSVTCNTILNNMDYLNPEKKELVPEDGIIFPAQKVTFYEGESVFNVLQREMKKNKIHMEFVNTPVYNSAYIEGIHNLYEFDCGELSGWMYKVNGWFPNYGCSRYQLQDGDKVEWVYTCDLGRDVGNYEGGSQK